MVGLLRFVTREFDLFGLVQGETIYFVAIIITTIILTGNTRRTMSELMDARRVPIFGTKLKTPYYNLMRCLK